MAQTRPALEPEESDINQKRFDWFYQQRAYPSGSFPSAARLRAIKQMESMLPRADKLNVTSAASSTQWTSIGPQPIGLAPFQHSGRVNTLAINPGNANIVYIGTDGGGIWETTNGGSTWVPLTDNQPSLTIRSIVLAPSNPNIIYAGTGLSTNGGAGAGGIDGAGILKSTDGGNTWTQIGGPFVQANNYIQSVYSVDVQPGGSQVVLAAAETLYRSTDGGVTWTSVLSGFSIRQVMFDSTNGNHALASGLLFGGSGPAGVFQSLDGGQTWAPTNGTGANSLPYSQFGWLTLVPAPSSPNVLYVGARLTSNAAPAFYKSVDSGSNWTPITVPSDDVINYWGWSLCVHPTNANIVYAGSLLIHLSLDGGATWTDVSSNVHVDHHVQAFTGDGSLLYIGNDGGVWKTTNPTNPSGNWTNLNTAITSALFYPGLSIHPSDVNTAFGGTQDNGTLQYGGSVGWQYAACGDGGYTAIDFSQPENVYGACQGIDILKSTSSGSGQWQPAQTGINAQDRVAFIPPLVMDPSNSQRLYFGTYRVYQTTNAAQSWSAISPDVTKGDPYGIVSAITVAPSDANTVYTGSRDGMIYVSRNALSGAATWSNSSSGVPGRAVTQIAVHPQDAATAYAAISGYGGAHVFKTSNAGTTWTDTGSSNLPDIPVNDILVDPDHTSLLYLATDIGVYRSLDSGASWAPLGSGLPRVVVSAIKLHRASRTLRAATYGRGVWDLYDPLTGQILVNINSSIMGAPFQLEDGTTYQTPITFSWSPGTQHTITWLGSLPGHADERYAFHSWVDGGSNPRTITVPASPTTYTANITAQFHLALTISPAGAGAISATPSSVDGFYANGTNVALTAAPSPGYYFGYYSGDVTGSSPKLITMNSQHSVTAKFFCGYAFERHLPYEIGPGPTAGMLVWPGVSCSGTASSNAPWLSSGPHTTFGGLNIIPFAVSENTGTARAAALTVSDNVGNPVQMMKVSQDSAGAPRPSIVSLTPNSGSGSNAVFSLQAYDASGYGNLSYVWLTFATLSGSSCTVDILYGGDASVSLSDSNGNSAGPIGLPSMKTLQTNLCGLQGALSSVSGSGKLLNIKLGLTFSNMFIGVQFVTAGAADGRSQTASLEEVVGAWMTTASPATTVRDFQGNGLAGELLYIPSSGQSYTALSNGNGAYTYIPILFTRGFDTLRTGDYNGEGKADLILYNSQNALAYIGFGKGDGTFNFQSLFWSPGYNDVETGDINGDGKTDVALYNSTTGTLYTGISNGDGTFTYQYHLVSRNYSFVRLADFNGDGKADIFLYRASDGLAYLGIGDGTGVFAFTPLFISPGYGILDTGDLNGDGKADLILYNPTNGNTATGISNGMGGGFTFTPLLFSPGFSSVRLGDYTGDGKADITVYNKNTAAAYFGTGNGDGTFTFQSLFWSPGYDYVIPEDVNGDGKTDIVLYSSPTGTEYTGISNGNGTFNYTYTYWGIGRVLAQ